MIDKYRDSILIKNGKAPLGEFSHKSSIGVDNLLEQIREMERSTPEELVSMYESAMRGSVSRVSNDPVARAHAQYRSRNMIEDIGDYVHLV